ncbi:MULTISPECIES: DsbE family thiol:disulfide interchange protein [unclassified Lysobacter]|jgi:cytochrome c biogenesis protein CcmG/thiol:disulfide interchange protein DsbE|uniref:DsbE family thiol:disulfide interchange protein n=1 Tax=unclassified Lysobacter TaxID=2635362 RepID=UPI0006F39141|nr:MULTISPECIES: DsbE family thiol:disulfide interchange protein [unclassified Lysobacter]KQZ67836.1 thiol:disulfide interchange protein [Lysobacter sp. Root559]KRA74718.1 thiol:disulfide interchange protein [Lysobacter sp. Root667]KRC38164.1 thiol:disulfide interchange protein [Lysobacter sp. Root76]KRD69488.1 thiol:disulfide interchange protein [Lysobacter sp. Root96]
MNKSRWLPLAAFAVLAVLLAAGVWLSRNPNREALPSPLIGKPAPEFSLPVLHEAGRLMRSDQLRGSPYLLNVWGSWCPACRDEHPVLTRFAETKRVRVIGFNWKDEHADALRWLEQYGNPYWMVLTDYDGKVAIDWGIYGAPETFLVDAKGVVRWKHVGPMSEATIRDELLPVLAEVEKTR